MVSPEDKLGPPRGGESLPRDMLTIAVVTGLAVVLPVGWPIQFNTVLPWNLLPALGLMLALRRGAIDLSVWAAAGLGGLAAAGAMNAGYSPIWVLAAAMGAGLAVGAVNAALVAGVRVPSVIVTAVVGLAVVWGAGQFTHGRSVAIAESAYDGWHLTRTVTVPGDEVGPTEDAGDAMPATTRAATRAAVPATMRAAVPATMRAATRAAVPAKPQAAGEEAAGEEAAVQEVWLPLRATRAMVVGLIYSVVVVVLVGMLPVEVRRTKRDGRWGLVAALCASGLLAGAGGMCWLLDHPMSAPVPTRLVDGLQVPTAVVLAGTLFLGRWRTTLAVFCLPVAMLLSAAWRQQVWDLYFAGYSLQLGLLAVLVVGVHACFACASTGWPLGRWLGGLGTAAAVGGILLVAAAAGYGTHQVRHRFHVAGLVVWLAGIAAAVTAAVLDRTPPARRSTRTAA